MAASKPYYLRT